MANIQGSILGIIAEAREKYTVHNRGGRDVGWPVEGEVTK